MNKDQLEYILLVLIRVLETKGSKKHIEEFKAKYSGIRWDAGLTKSLLMQTRNTLKLNQWITNIIDFMLENDISIDLGRHEAKIN